MCTIRSSNSAASLSLSLSLFVFVCVSVYANGIPISSHTAHRHAFSWLAIRVGRMPGESNKSCVCASTSNVRVCREHYLMSTVGGHYCIYIYTTVHRGNKGRSRCQTHTCSYVRRTNCPPPSLTHRSILVTPGRGADSHTRLDVSLLMRADLPTLGNPRTAARTARGRRLFAALYRVAMMLITIKNRWKRRVHGGGFADRRRIYLFIIICGSVSTGDMRTHDHQHTHTIQLYYVY